MRIPFNKVGIGQAFKTVGVGWVKQSTRTAKMDKSPYATFYFKQLEYCLVTPSTQADQRVIA